jgi:hypothetical protein
MKKVSATAIAVLAISVGSCGGNGSGSGASAPIAVTPAPTPSPSSTPTPTPTPSPTVNAQTFVQPGLAAGGTGNTLDPQNATAFSVTVSEPDIPNARSFADINFDGDETITVQHSASTAAYNETFAADSYRGTSRNAFYTGSSSERFVPSQLYQSRPGQASSAFLIMPLLEEVRKTATTASVTGNVPESVRLLDVRTSSGSNIQNRSLQLVGTRTTAAGVPTSGARTFVGESYGTRYFSNSNLQDYIGDSVLSVDYSRRTFSGQVTIAQFLGSTPVQPTLTVEIAGEIGADGTLTGKITVRGSGVFEAGYLSGALYGPTGDELGLVLYSSGASGSVLGGVVAGQE